MANAYGIQRNRRGWIDPTDQDFTLKALMYKQQKYDANKAKVQSVVEQYKALQVARGVDRDYINQRLEYLVNNVNQFGPQDFSSNGVTESIQYHLGQVLDENVMTAVKETAKIQAYQSEVAKIKEKTPELYNQLNEAYGLSPAQSYLQSDKVGDTIKGSLTYTPYQDIEGDIQKILLDIQKNAKDGSYEYESKPGQLVKVTVNGKSESELREIALGVMGDKYNPQFTINAWGKYGGFKNIEGTVAQMGSYYNNLINAHDKDISEYKAQLSGDRVSESQKAELQEKIKGLENQKLSIQNRMVNFQKDPVSGLVAMEKEGVASRLGKSLGLLRTEKMEYKKDDYYFGMLNYNLDVDKANWDKQMDQAKLDLDRQIHSDNVALKNQELAIKASGLGGGDGDSTSSGNNGGGTARIIQTEGVNEPDKGVGSNFTQVNEDLNKTQSELYSVGRTVVDSLVNIASGADRNADAEMRQQAKELINNYKSKYGALPQNIRQMTPTQVVNFMDMYSRTDAYGALAYIPIGGEISITGETSSKGSLKSRWTDLKNMKDFKFSSYNKAVKEAQADMVKAGRPSSEYRDSQVFKNYLKTASQDLSNLQQFTMAGLTKKDISNLNALASSKGTDWGNFEPPKEGGSLSFQKTKDGQISFRYQVDAKDANKNSIVKNSQTYVVDVNTFNKFFNVGNKINLDSKRSMFTWQNMGTREVVSSNIGFVNPNSKYYNANMQEARGLTSDQNDLRYITEDGMKQTMSSVLSGYTKSEDKEKAKRLMNVLGNGNNINNFGVVIQFVPSYNGSGKSDLTVRLVNRESKETYITQTLEGVESADELMKLNERYPQILYSKLIMGELTKMVSQNPNELTPTLGLTNMLKS